MSETEIAEFNRKHMVEVEMKEIADCGQVEVYRVEQDIHNKIWNKAIEAAAKEAESKSHILLPLEARIRMLKK